MTYTTLTGAKNTSGSLANWVNYSRLDIGVVLDEAQALLYQYLRVREMRARGYFTLLQGSVFSPLPANYLDPAGPMFASSLNLKMTYLDTTDAKNRRLYDQLSGALGADPFTTVSGSSTVTVALPAHSFNQGGIFNSSGAAAVGGLTPNGTFEIIAVSTNSFDIDAGSPATSSATGGGSAVTYVCQNLIQGSPDVYSIWDERFQFNVAFNDTVVLDHFFYRSLPLLSSSNPSNFLCTRYPNLLRTACQVSSADYMKDDDEYQKGLQRIQLLIQRVQAQDELLLRGAEIMTETP